MDRRRALGASALALAAAWALQRCAGARVDDVPLFGVHARGRVGAGFASRSGLAGAPVAGEMDDLDAFARDDFDTTRVAPAVREFYERTGEYRMTVAAEWHRPFRSGAVVASRLASAVEQLALPGPHEADRVRVVDSEFLAVDATGDIDPTAERVEDARFWVRTDVESGDAVFVAVYGSHVDDGERFVNIAVPLPGATLSTVLRMGALALPDRDDVGVRLTTRAPGHPGLYLSTSGLDVRLPMQQTFRVWPADATPPADAPDVDVTAALDAAGGDPALDVAAGDPALDVVPGERDAGAPVVATHEMWLRDRPFLTVRYVAFRTSPGE